MRGADSTRSYAVHTRRSRGDPDKHDSDNDGNNNNKNENVGVSKYRLEKSARREDRLSWLESKADRERLTEAERKEWDGLLAAGLCYEEQYDPARFSDTHAEFKALHNDVLVDLARYCAAGKDEEEPPRVFYLDGPDAATTGALFRAGFDPARCHVANRHGSTCDALRAYGLPPASVAFTTAKDAFAVPVDDHDDDRPQGGDAGRFAGLPFDAYYFDGCGGHAPVVVDMLRAALSDLTVLRPPVAVGFSIVGGNRDVVDKELFVLRELVRMVRSCDLRVDHALDDPERYGIHESVRKIDDGAMTTWVVLERR